MYMGVDCGTQGTKVVILDPEQGTIRGEGYAAHQMISGPGGRREQEPEWWVDGLREAYRKAIDAAGVDSRSIRAIGVSGQQHGLVALNNNGEVIRPAKLWCDTETAPQNADLLRLMGGHAGSMDTLGLVVATGYTLSKLLWLKQNEPDSFAAIAHILLPHDYLNYWLTGNIVAEYGDSSGTGYFDIRERRWVPEVLALIDPDGGLERALPPLIEAQEPAGTVRQAVASELGLSGDVLVSSGGGDNMMGAIGTGNIDDGVITMSLGTSGAIYGFSGSAPHHHEALVAPFCSSSNGWLPLICTMNLTGVANAVRESFGFDIAAFEQHAARAPIGAEGITMLPFFNGERVPALPDASGTLLGLTVQNYTPANLCRAAYEGPTFGLRYGLDLLRGIGMKSRDIRLIGGGAKSLFWRQLVCDIMDTPVVCPEVVEAAALGGAIQAAWCDSHARGDGASLAELCKRFVALDESSAVTPDAESVAAYQHAYSTYRSRLSALHDVA
ncbi:xylulokinase [Oceanidesulfovibrio marinus]|uniref:Xylulose kinase n=1 Tax=Oceanidesulfovibrio marinus TaxID=370038 RepID=A0ABX6NFZ9_9BACT|nr:xylulokinase [Oceanidesulfovibrio marinus]QJT09555.1 xylulokinase [Oceanidesulfovibrio marinus]